MNSSNNNTQEFGVVRGRLPRDSGVGCIQLLRRPPLSGLLGAQISLLQLLLPAWIIRINWPEARPQSTGRRPYARSGARASSASLTLDGVNNGRAKLQRHWLIRFAPLAACPFASIDPPTRREAYCPIRRSRPWLPGLSPSPHPEETLVEVNPTVDALGGSAPALPRPTHGIGFDGDGPELYD